jgi:hypothetical protein
MSTFSRNKPPIDELYEPKPAYLGQGFQVLCQLRKGDKAISPKTGNPYPVNLDYWRASDFLNVRVQEAFYALYGEKPSEIDNVVLLGQTVSQAVPLVYEQWGEQSGLSRRCDGYSCYLWRDEKDPRLMRNEPIACKQHDEPPCECVLTARLTLILPDLIRRSREMGVVRLTLRNPKDIKALLDIIVDTGEKPSIPRLLGVPLSTMRWRITRVPVPMTRWEKAGNTTWKPAKVTQMMVGFVPDLPNMVDLGVLPPHILSGMLGIDTPPDLTVALPAEADAPVANQTTLDLLAQGIALEDVEPRQDLIRIANAYGEMVVTQEGKHPHLITFEELATFYRLDLTSPLASLEKAVLESLLEEGMLLIFDKGIATLQVEGQFIDRPIVWLQGGLNQETPIMLDSKHLPDSIVGSWELTPENPDSAFGIHS